MYVNEKGELRKSPMTFFKSYFVDKVVTGIAITELWKDTYQLNFENDAVVFPADVCAPFPFNINEYKGNREFARSGGFRLDFHYEKEEP